MKTQNIYLYLALPIIMGACSGKSKPAIEDKDSVAFNVQTEKVIAYQGMSKISYSGVVEAKLSTPLSFANMGSVVEVLVDEGQNVSKGQLLARLNSSNAENTYQLALQKQQQAEDAYKRLKPMNDNGSIPDIKMVEVETGLNQAKSAVAIAKKSIEDCSLYSPANGVIGKRFIQPGMNILPGVFAFDLLDISSVFVKIPVPENEIIEIKKNANATVEIAAVNQTLRGSIKEIGVSADILSHTYPVKIEVNNSSDIVKPGMVCSVSLESQTNSSGFLISNKALQQDVSGKQFVYISKNYKAKKQEVKTIALVGQQVLVSGNLNEGDDIIVSGQNKLQDNSPLNTIQ